MSEQERERIYWRLCIGCIILSPLAGYLLVDAHLSVKFSPFIFSGFLFASIPFTLVMDIALTAFSGKPLGKFWIKNPSVTGDYTVKDTKAHCIQSIVERLTRDNFSGEVVEDTAKTAVITFQKAKRPPVHAFINHRFWGQIQVTQHADRIDLHTEITFGDTVIFETGELEKTRALGAYFSLAAPEFRYRNVPLTLYCGVNLAFVTLLMSFLTVVYASFPSIWLFSTAAGAACLIIIMFVNLLLDRQQLFGYRIGLAGLYLALLPYMLLFIQ